MTGTARENWLMQCRFNSILNNSNSKFWLFEQEIKLSTYCRTWLGIIGNWSSSLSISSATSICLLRAHVITAAGAAGLILARGTHVTNESAVQVELIVKVTVFKRKFPKLDVVVSPNKLNRNRGFNFSLSGWFCGLLLNRGWMSGYLFSSGMYWFSVLDFFSPL